ncbi:MAG TPA: UvrD-helicase domain-containing protein [Terriglobales bacterium]|nr:UvrD-helicase domain-containing protein [Terriglobales bacterium]
MPSEAGTQPAQASDANARQLAVHADHSVLVRAPAGSGKTELLTQRFLRLLSQADQPEQLLALTFTRKAAAEMRGRVLDALAAPATALATQAARRNDESGWNLLENRDRLRIMTLDSLALRLVSRMPWVSRLGGVPRPTEDADQIFLAAARATLRRAEVNDDELAAAARAVLLRAYGDWDGVENLLAKMLEHRDQWLRLLIPVAREPEKARPRLELAMAQATAAEFAGLLPRLETDVASPLPDFGDWASWRALAEKALTRQGTVRKRGIWPNLSGAACKALAAIAELPEAEFSPEQWEFMRALLTLLPQAAAELQVQFAERGECDFTEITLAALRGLDGEPNRLRYALDGALRHLFVDEVQDTSRAQFQLLEALVADWQPDDGRTLFLVGDPMQSIYGFRNADVGMFLQAAASGRLGTVALRELQLSANYRSQSGLVHWCNQLFSRVSPTADDPMTGTAKFVEATPALAADGPPARWHWNGSPTAVADLVESELQNHENKQIALLGFGRAQLEPVVAELMRRGVAVRAERLLSLAESPVVSDLMAITQALATPADRVAWLALLRAPWCGVTLADLEALCADDKYGLIVDFLHDDARLARLSADGRSRIEKVRPALLAAARQSGRAPMRKLVEWCWRALDGPALAGEHAEDADVFFESLEHGTENLQRELEKLKTSPHAGAQPSEARVVAMTIHHAKGLQFDVVIIPGLDREPRRNDPPLLRWLETEQHWLIAGKPLKGSTDRRYDFLGRLQQAWQDQEQLRNFYVAATRARLRLHLIANPTPQGTAPRPRSPLARLWTALDTQEIPWRQPIAKSEKPVNTAVAPAHRVTSDWTPPVAVAEVTIEPALPRPARVGRLQRQVGVAVHAVLQRVSASPSLDWPAAEMADAIGNALLAAGVAPSDMVLAQSRATAAVRSTLSDERGRWVLGPHRESRSEWRLSGAVEGDRRVDRSFIDDDGARWIIDYKVAFHEGADVDQFLDQQVAQYSPQLGGYAALVRALTGGKVRCALYFPVQQAWRELYQI